MQNVGLDFDKEAAFSSVEEYLFEIQDRLFDINRQLGFLPAIRNASRYSPEISRCRKQLTR